MAEAELEYNENHVSKAVTVKFKIDASSVPNDVPKPAGSDLYALIWTTTPWTLPANQAIAFNEFLSYSLVNIAGSKDIFVVASERVPELEKLIKKTINKVGDISSKISVSIF